MIRDITIGNRKFPIGGHTFVMGILNVTPDSFSDGGRYNRLEDALRHAERMIAEGAGLLDVGGESTRPGYKEISEEEEIERTAPVIRALKERFDIPISIDTYKGPVAAAAVQAGVDLLNDIWGLKHDSRMAKTAAESGLPICLMHNRRERAYGNFLNDVCEDLKESLITAQKAGICREKIILDPGIGFGKSDEENLWMLKQMERLQEFGLPLLLGASRKSVIGKALSGEKNALPAPGEREEGTLALSVLAVMKGYSFVRVHDVEKNVRAIRMAEAVLYAKEPGEG